MTKSLLITMLALLASTTASPYYSALPSLPYYRSPGALSAAYTSAVVPAPVPATYPAAVPATLPAAVPAAYPGAIPAAVPAAYPPELAAYAYGGLGYSSLYNVQNFGPSPYAVAPTYGYADFLYGR